MKNFTTELGLFLNTDCFDVLSDIEDNSVDMILADLPYGTTQNKWDTVLPLDELWAHYNRIGKINCPIVLTSCQPFTTTLIQSNIKWFKYQWYWVKNKASGHLNAKKQPMRNVEDILVFYKKQPTYNPQMWESRPANYAKSARQSDNYGKQEVVEYSGGNTSRYPLTTLEVPVINNDSSSIEKRLHPTQKPVALMEYLIKTYTNEGDMVLDNTAGVCSTGIAAENLGRRWLCIEKEEEFFDKGVERFQKEELNE